MTVTKTEGGMQFPAEAYAYVPDAKSPSTWKLRLWETPESKVTAAQVGRAVAALGKGFRGQKAQIPEAARAAVIAKVHAAWEKANPGSKKADVPAALKEAATTELTQISDLVYDELCDAMQKDAAAEGAQWPEPWSIEALFPDRVIVYQDGRYWSYPYTITDDNQVTLGEEQEVLESFTAVGPAAGAASKATASDGTDDGRASSSGAGGTSDNLKEALVFLEAKDAEGKVWDAVLIRSGTSKNGTYYPDSVLREAAPLFEGARVFALADAKHLGDPMAKRDINALAGWISGPAFVSGASADSGYLRGMLNIAGGQTQLRETLVDAWKRGKRDLVGLSIDAGGSAKPYSSHGAKRIATAISKVESVDLIVEPSAGGALVRLAEAADDNKGNAQMKERMLATIKAKRPDLFAKIDPAKITDEELEARYAEALAPAKTDTQAGPALSREEFDAYIKLTEARASAAAKINATTLPPVAKEKLVARFNALARFTEADVDTEIKAERDYAVRMIEAAGGDAGKVRLPAGDGARAEDRSTKIAHMLDAFFNPGGKDAEGKAYPKVHSFKECYVEITGDKRVTGRIENADRSRLAEAVGAAFRESVDTTAFSNVLGSSITRRMVQEYNNTANWDGYKQIVGQPVPLNDFRQQVRVRFGGYGDLPIVTQSSAYAALASPTDEAPTYTPAKRGGTEDVTFEAIKNDDVGAIRKIPVRMGRAAKRTLAKFVFDFLRTNPTIYDSVAFFHASHGNLGSTAFSAAEYGVVRIAMAKQAELNSADRLGIYPNVILYPLDLQETVWNAFQRNTNLDKTFVQQLNPVLVPVWYWTDTNDWVAMADPNDVQVIEIGFLDGQEEPSLYVQDMPNVGSMFSNDKLTYKIRHIYGGGVVDYRGAYKEVV